jgi:ribosomal protein uS17
MASTEAMEEPVAEAEEVVDPGTADADAAPQPEAVEDAVEPAVEQAEQAEEAEPVAEGPVAEETVAAEPSVSETQGEAAAESEAPAEEPVAEEPVAEEPVAEEPVAEEPVAEEPVAEETVAEEAPAQEPEAEAEPEAEPEAEASAPAPAPQSGPKPKRKRLPRALRPKKGRVKRERAAERKPIVRVPKPEREFGRRQERQGTVVSDKGDKTIVVKVDTIKAHPRYKKVVRRSKRFHAHDEQNQAKIGDVVKIVETRPLSKTKNWRLAEILEVAK